MLFVELLEHAILPSEQFKRLAKQAMSQLRDSDNEAAIATATRLIFLYPKHGYGYVIRGYAHQQKQNFDSAINDYSIALEYKGYDDTAFIYYSRATAYHQMRKKDEAITDYADALRLGLNIEQAVSALVNRAHLLASKGEIERAEDNFLKILEIDPERKNLVYDQLSLAMLWCKAYEKAIHYFTASIALNSKNASAYGNRAYAYIKQGQFELAYTDCNEAIRLDPTNPHTYNNRGFIYLHSGNSEGALANYLRAIEIKPDFANPWSGMGDVYFVRNEYGIALENYKKALDLKPNTSASLAASAGMAITHHVLGQVDEAVQLWRSLIESDAHFREADWLQKEYGWTSPLIEEAQKIISKLEL